MATLGHAFGASICHPNPSKTCPDFLAEGLFDVREVKSEGFGTA